MILHVKSKKHSEVWETWQRISQDLLYYLSHGLLVMTLIEGWAVFFLLTVSQRAILISLDYIVLL